MEHALPRLQEFIRFLQLKVMFKDFEGEKLSPTPLMDSLWHAAILETRLYRRLHAALGLELSEEFIEHSPQGASMEPAAAAKRKSRLENMRTVYRLKFNSEPLEQAAFEAPRPAPAASSGAAAASRRLNLKLRSPDGSVVVLALSSDTPFSKMMRAYCQRGDTTHAQLRVQRCFPRLATAHDALIAWCVSDWSQWALISSLSASCSTASL